MAHLTDQPGGPALAQPVRAVPAATRRSGLPGTLRSEFTKLRSVRSTWITLAVFFVASVVIAVLAAAGDRRNSGQAQFDPARDSLAGMLYLGMLVIGATGVLAIASEYGTRMIATSMTAMPRRAVLYAAKAIALACVTLAVALVTAVTSFFAGQAAVASTHAGASITSPGTLRALLLATLFVSCFALVAFGLGAVIRHTAGAITAVFGLVFLLPMILGAFPASWSSALGRWLPDNTVLLQIVAAKPTGQHDLFGPYGELAVFAGYAVIALAAGAVAFCRRDA
jgi:ABC-type transport system involved in multi-copper enzyme maturation permease subunit